MVSEDKDEITVHQFLIKLKSTFKIFISNWLIILFFSLIGLFIGFFYAYSQPGKYTAALSFVLSNESKPSNLSGLASQFGIDLGSGSNSDVFSGDNIITLFKSKRMIKQVLFKVPPGQESSLLNMVVNDLGLNKKWENINRLKDQWPLKPGTKTSLLQDSLVNDLYLRIVKDFLYVSRPDKKLSVYEVSTTSSNPLFACYLTRYLVDETSKFYIETKTSISKQNLKMLQKEADSLRSLLGVSIVNTSSEMDRTFNLNPAMQAQRSNIQKGQINSTVLGSAYGEVVKNLELAKINLQKETPLYQIIDAPELPLVQIRYSKILYSILGFSIFFFFGVIFVFFSKIF